MYGNKITLSEHIKMINCLILHWRRIQLFEAFCCLHRFERKWKATAAQPHFWQHSLAQTIFSLSGYVPRTRIPQRLGRYYRNAEGFPCRADNGLEPRTDSRQQRLSLYRRAATQHRRFGLTQYKQLSACRWIFISGWLELLTWGRKMLYWSRQHILHIFVCGPAQKKTPQLFKK